MASIGKLRSSDSVLKKLDIVSNKTLSTIFGVNEAELSGSIEYIIKAIKATIQNRKVSNGVLIRAHSKIKHGMAVYLDGKI